MTENVIIVIIYLKKERMIILSRLTFSVLVNDILDSLDYKMLKIEFNDENIARIDYTKDGSVIRDMLTTGIMPR